MLSCGGRCEQRVQRDRRQRRHTWLEPVKNRPERDTARHWVQMLSLGALHSDGAGSSM